MYWERSFGRWHYDYTLVFEFEFVSAMTMPGVASDLNAPLSL